MTEIKKHSRKNMMEDLYQESLEASLIDKAKDGLNSFKEAILGKSRPNIIENFKEIEELSKKPISDPNKTSTYRVYSDWSVLMIGTTPVSDFKSKASRFNGIERFSIKKGAEVYDTINNNWLKKPYKAKNNVPDKTLTEKEARELLSLLKREYTNSDKAMKNIMDNYIQMQYSKDWDEKKNGGPKEFRKANNLYLVYHDFISTYVDLVKDSFKTLTK